MEAWITPVMVFLGVIASAGVTYLIARRNSSGSISTSDAASLWKESNDLRQEYRQRAEDLEKQLTEVNSKLQAVMDELGNLKLNSATMIEKIAELKQIITQLREENARLLALKKDVTP